MRLPDKVYDTLKWIALVVMDAIGFGYAELADIWGLPYGDAVCRTCAALAWVLGALLGISTAEYRKKSLVEINEDLYKKRIEQYQEELDSANDDYEEDDNAE